MAGQGHYIGLEIMEQLKDVDAVVYCPSAAAA